MTTKKKITKKSATKTKVGKKVIAKKAKTAKKPYDFRRLLGLGLRGPQNPNPMYMSDRDIWR